VSDGKLWLGIVVGALLVIVYINFVAPRLFGPAPSS